MSNGNVMIICLIAGLIKKDIVKKNKRKFEIDLSNYEIKADLKGWTDIDTSIC